MSGTVAVVENRGANLARCGAVRRWRGDLGIRGCGAVDSNLLKDIGLRLIPLRKKNSKRPLNPVVTYLRRYTRCQSWPKNCRKAEQQFVTYRETLERAYGDTFRLQTHAVICIGLERLVW